MKILMILILVMIAIAIVALLMLRRKNQALPAPMAAPIPSPQINDPNVKIDQLIRAQDYATAATEIKRELMLNLSNHDLMIKLLQVYGLNNQTDAFLDLHQKIVNIGDSGMTQQANELLALMDIPTQTAPAVSADTQNNSLTTDGLAHDALEFSATHHEAPISADPNAPAPSLDDLDELLLSDDDFSTLQLDDGTQNATDSVIDNNANDEYDLDGLDFALDEFDAKTTSAENTTTADELDALGLEDFGAETADTVQDGKTEPASDDFLDLDFELDAPLPQATEQTAEALTDFGSNASATTADDLNVFDLTDFGADTSVETKAPSVDDFSDLDFSFDTPAETDETATEATTAITAADELDALGLEDFGAETTDDDLSAFNIETDGADNQSVNEFEDLFGLDTPAKTAETTENVTAADELDALVLEDFGVETTDDDTDELDVFNLNEGDISEDGADEVGDTALDLDDTPTQTTQPSADGAVFDGNLAFVNDLNPDKVTLELAQHYANLGETASATRLLKEVISAGGTDAAAAQSLLDRL